MREDMGYINGVLEELEVIVEDASRVPMRRGLAVVDRSDLLVMMDELRASLPGELRESESIRRECREIIAAAEEEARRIIEAAHERADIMASETDVYRRAQRRSQENIDRAERYAQEVTGGSEVYRDRVMEQLESWFKDSIVSVQESRQELDGASVRRSGGGSHSISEEEGEEHRRASSA
jgi:vacuolar-type H+-ATPase subunit H